jgi:hypothetical protein
MSSRLIFSVLFALASFICRANMVVQQNIELDTSKHKWLSFLTPQLGYIKQDLWQFGGNFRKIKDELNQNNFLIGATYNTDKSASFRLGYGSLRKISASSFLKSKLSWKRNPYFRSEDFDYTLNYNKFRADIEFLQSLESNSKYFTSISVINEQQASFSNNSVIKKSVPLYDFKLGYANANSSEIGDLHQSFTLEYGQYKDPFLDNKSFSKLTYSINGFTKIDKKRKLHLGAFVAYMLSNDNRKSQSYANELVKGTISLSGQSMGDYLYEHDYFSRKGPSDFLDNQFAIQGGRMRFFNTRGSRVGLSNDLAYVLSSSIEVVKNNFLTFSPYLDYGGYSDFSSGKRTLKNIYSGGLELKLKDYLLIYVPIFQSNEIKIANNFSQKSIFNRIGFNIDLRKMYFNSSITRDIN